MSELIAKYSRPLVEQPPWSPRGDTECPNYPILPCGNTYDSCHVSFWEDLLDSPPRESDIGEAWIFRGGETRGGKIDQYENVGGGGEILESTLCFCSTGFAECVDWIEEEEEEEEEREEMLVLDWLLDSPLDGDWSTERHKEDVGESKGGEGEREKAVLTEGAVGGSLEAMQSGVEGGGVWGRKEASRKVEGMGETEETWRNTQCRH